LTLFEPERNDRVTGEIQAKVDRNWRDVEASQEASA